VTRTGKGLLVFYVAAVLCAALIVYAIWNTNHQAYLACKRVQSLQQYATATIVRSEKTLPTLAYYRAHPKELAAQMGNIEESKKAFAPVSCHRNIIGG
jgi:hypothetical protein